MTSNLIVKKYRGTIPTMCLLFLIATIAVAQSTSGSESSGTVPQLVKFAGVLKDNLGHAKTGMVGMTFALYKEQYDGAPLWLETQNVEADSEGSYSVLLGSAKTEGMPADLFNTNEPRWLGVQVEGQAEQPRVLFVSVPYALRASDAATIGGLPPSAFMRAPEPGTSRANNSSLPSGSYVRAQPLRPVRQPVLRNSLDQVKPTSCRSGLAPQLWAIQQFSKPGGKSALEPRHQRFSFRSPHPIS